LTAAPLEGVKVLDVTHYIAGPYCTKLLALLGAEVIKIEEPNEGDGVRRIAPFFVDAPIHEQSSLFFYLNTNKKGITLDLKQQTGKIIYKRLVKEVDIVVENFSPRVMPSLGLDYITLKKVNPRLVMTSISNFGHSGPYMNWKSSEVVSYALSGVTYSSFGTPERGPLKPFGSIAQHISGIYAATGTMTALNHSQRTGVGQHVDISILECVASMEEHSLVMAAYRNETKKQSGRLHPSNHPTTISRCKDGYVQLSVATPYHWQRLCLIAGLPEDWRKDDSPFMTGSYRRQHYREIDIALEPWLMSHTREEIQEMAREVLIPVVSVKTIPEIMDDPQYKARDFFIEVEHPYAGKVTIPGMPFKMSENPNRIGRAPLLGEHNEEIYCQRLGYSKEELLRLRGQGVV
jgi:crotonobetainyl-CoA:carnitine CoA-transferase CaiB-like acyl-CoA transferase